MFGYREKVRSVWLFLSVDTLDCGVATACFIYVLFDTFLLNQLFRLHFIEYASDCTKAFLLTKTSSLCKRSADFFFFFFLFYCVEVYWKNKKINLVLLLKAIAKEETTEVVCKGGTSSPKPFL